MQNNPVLVHNTRGDLVESQHRGAVAVCDPAGRVLHAWGDSDALVYPRSAIKPLQALPLLESGAADEFELDPSEITLACSSHLAQPVHTDAVSAWLERLSLDEGDLECGPHAPYHEQTSMKLFCTGHTPGRIHNNCSGKHTAMLTTARFYDEPTRGYSEREHPVQQRWFDVLGEMADVDMRNLPWNRDGCGIPVIAMPLSGIATAFARLAAPDDLSSDRAAAIERIGGAIAQHPLMIAGSGSLVTELMTLTGRRVLIKNGADGVYAAALPEAGLGVALKIDDGNKEAAEVTLLAVLAHLGALQQTELESLSGRARIAIVNSCGRITGYRESIL